jgi:hypothetical protein
VILDELANAGDGADAHRGELPARAAAVRDGHPREHLGRPERRRERVADLVRNVPEMSSAEDSRPASRLSPGLRVARVH